MATAVRCLGAPTYSVEELIVATSGLDGYQHLCESDTDSVNIPITVLFFDDRTLDDAQRYSYSLESQGYRNQTLENSNAQSMRICSQDLGQNISDVYITLRTDQGSQFPFYLSAMS